MSSYLTFYIKDDKTEPISLIEYSRNHNVYQYFNDTIRPAYIESDIQYTELDELQVKKVLDSITEDIKSSQKRLTEYEKYAGQNPDYIEDILDLREYIEELETAYNITDFILDIIVSSKYSTNNKKILCNID